KWVRVTGSDPLEVAAESGVELSGGSAALIASHGLLARVDLKTGLLGDVVQFAKGEYLSTCSIVRVAESAWVGCALSTDASPDLFDPWGVFRVPLETSTLRFDKPALIRTGEAELRSSPSGGHMLM